MQLDVDKTAAKESYYIAMLYDSIGTDEIPQCMRAIAHADETPFNKYMEKNKDAASLCKAEPNALRQLGAGFSESRANLFYYR